MKDILLNERYRIDRKIGWGGSCLVYAGVDIQSNENVAIKLVFKKYWEMARWEWETHVQLSGGVGIPRARWHGSEEDYEILVLDLLGPTLEDLLNYCGRRFTLKTLLLLADQAISRIQYIHSKRFIYCDIKPENFMMGIGRRGNVLYITDFGITRMACHPSQDTPYRTLSFCGSHRYASINVHNYIEPSCRDDLEALGYCLIYLSRGSLPWSGLNAYEIEEDREKMKEMKTNMPLEELCEGLPGEFVEYLNYTRSLAFNQKPNYRYLRQLFQRRFAAEGFSHDHIYDWTIKLFNKLHNGGDESGSEEDTGEEDTGEEDTGEEDTGEEDTGEEDTGEEDTGEEDTGEEGEEEEEVEEEEEWEEEEEVEEEEEGEEEEEEQEEGGE